MSTTLESASRTLLDNYARVSSASVWDFPGSADGISRLDLKAIANSTDPAVSTELRDAARFVLNSKTAVRFLDVGAARGNVDGFISQDDLQGAIRTLQSGNGLPELLDTADGIGGRDGNIGDNDYRAALTDPGLPKDLRNAILRDLDDQQLLRIFGQPNVQGSDTEKQDLSKTVLNLVRLSPTHALEAKALIDEQVPISFDNGADDKGFSYWSPDTKSLHISRSMVTNGDPQYLTEVLAHEGGHAIFHYSGMEAKVQLLESLGKIPKGMSGIINEAFAGSFGNRARLAQKGSADNLALADDVAKNIASDDTFYAKHYSVDTADARAHIDDIHDVLRMLAPYLRDDFGMRDPQLAQGL